jgi:hypothetical protein
LKVFQLRDGKDSFLVSLESSHARSQSNKQIVNGKNHVSREMSLAENVSLEVNQKSIKLVLCASLLEVLTTSVK